MTRTPLVVGVALGAGALAAGAVWWIRGRAADPDATLDGLDVPPPEADVTPDLLLGELQQIMPRLSEAKATEYLPYLNAAMDAANITTQLRRAAFLAQLAEESGELKYMEEEASGAEYEGRKDLGNTTPGDGVRFKGRGPIQLTGRTNYTNAGQALGLDLVANPEQAALPSVGFRTAAWFWESHGLNALADQRDIVAITKIINGGTNGLAVRQAYYATAMAALGVVGGDS